MDLEVAAHCVAPLSRDYLSKLPHHVLPCMNLRGLFPFEKSEEVVKESFCKKAPWRSSIPIPLTPLASTTFEALNGIDVTTTLIREKIKWQMKKEKILNAVKKDKKNINGKVLRRAELAEVNTTTEIPHGVALLAKHLDKDPDPNFAGVYNWYYTGGTLANVEHNDEKYLLHASQSKLSCSKHNEDGGQSELLFTLSLDRSIPIHQIAASAVGVAVRQKSCVNLFAIGESGNKLCLKKIHSVSDKRDPFLSVALQDKSNKKYCTITSNGILKLWDVEYTKSYKMKLQVAPGEGERVMDSWSSIQFVDKRTLLLADKCCIRLLDCRMDMKEKQLAWCPRNLGEQCEQLSYVTRSQLQDQVVYAMTTHQALTLDLRIGFRQCWTHMMSAPPYVGFTHAIDNEQEFLCIGSQVMSDCIVVVNNWNESNPRAEYRPILLPSPSQGMLLSRQQGVCLEPSLSQRCCQSLIGLTCLPSANGLNVVRQSATGDVFVQKLSCADDTESYDKLDSKQLTAYSDWGRPAMTLQRDTTTVSATDVKNFTPMLEALTDTFPAEEPSCDDEVGGGWKRSKQYLEDCVDLLAPKLLAVWEMEDEEEWQEQVEETLVEQDPAEKVHNWLQAGNVTFNENALADMSSLKPKVTSTPFVMPSTELKSPANSEDEPSPWMTNLGQRLPQTPTTPLPHLIPNPPSPHPSIWSSGSDKPPRKRQRLFDDGIATPPKQPTPAAKKPTTSTAKKKFIPGF